MWVKKADYEKLKNTAEGNEHAANKYHYIEQCVLSGNSFYLFKDFAIIKLSTFNELMANRQEALDKIKDLQAEIEYYKVKYHEMKMKAEVEKV